MLSSGLKLAMLIQEQWRLRIDSIHIHILIPFILHSNFLSLFLLVSLLPVGVTVGPVRPSCAILYTFSWHAHTYHLFGFLSNVPCIDFISKTAYAAKETAFLVLIVCFIVVCSNVKYRKKKKSTKEKN